MMFLAGFALGLLVGVWSIVIRLGRQQPEEECWEEFPEDSLCPHGEDPSECEACFAQSDFEYDCWREHR